MNTKSKRGDADVAALVFILVIASFIVGCTLGNRFTEESYRTQAVKLGHATGVVDEAGNTTFKWKEAQ